MASPQTGQTGMQSRPEPNKQYSMRTTNRQRNHQLLPFRHANVSTMATSSVSQPIRQWLQCKSVRLANRLTFSKIVAVRMLLGSFSFRFHSLFFLQLLFGVGRHLLALASRSLSLKVLLSFFILYNVFFNMFCLAVN